MADSTTTTYPVARVYKDTGKFEGIEGVECGKTTDTNNSLLSTFSGIVSGPLLILNNGIAIATSNSNSWMDLNPGAETTITFKSGSDPVLVLALSSDTTNRTVTASSSYWSTAPNDVGDLIIDGITFGVSNTIMKAWGVSDLDISSANGVATLSGSTGSTSWHEGEWILKDYERFKMKSVLTPSVSKQGICTFSEIVELGNVTDTAWSGEGALSSNINFNNGYKISRNFPLAMSSNMSFALQNVTNDIVITYAIVIFSTSGDTEFNPISSTWTTQIEPLVINRVTMQKTNLNLAPNAAWTVYRNETEEAKFENSIYDSSVGTFWDATTDWSIPYYERFNMSSISKSTGVLTCSEFIEGDHSTLYNGTSGFMGTISGNKITCNHGYTFELLLQSDQSAVNWSDIFSTSSFVLVGSASLDTTDTNSLICSLDTSQGKCTLSTASTHIWFDSVTLYVYMITFSASFGSTLYYIKITDPDGKSVLYENTSSNYKNFYAIESGDDEWWIPSKYRYQNYLT